MQCPYCKKENSEYPQPCPECGYDPTVPYEPATSHASRIALASFILAILSFFTFLITAIPAIILACIALRRIRRKPERLKGRRLAIASIIISVFTSVVILPILFFLWRLDAPPIPNDYTIADLRSAPEEYAKSFDLLKKSEDERARLSDALIDLSQQDVEALRETSWTYHYTNARESGLFAEDVNMLYDIHEGIENAGGWSDIAEIIDGHAEPIMQAWENGIKGRQLIAELNRFAEISDLTEPNMFSEWGSLSKLRTLVHLYNSASLVLARQGYTDTAIAELAQIYTVTRKLSLNVRSSFWRRVCVTALLREMNSANFIANDPNITIESVRALANHFSPLTTEETSFRNSIIFEYLTIQAVLSELPENFGLLRFHKYNSSCRLLRNFCDDWIRSEDFIHEPPRQRLSVWPAVYPDCPVAIKADEYLPWHYFAYNPIGALLISLPAPAMNKVFREAFSERTKLQIHDDLLQIVLNKRLGKPVSLKARTYSDEYIVDVKGKEIFSPGPDGRVGTKDDISLPLNPEVLRWGDGDE